ncbi:MAG TPA: hypothetical protein VG941_02450 [Candidatus Paceibacterota bacterium]|nr:hypothetical protein [Candidatus Paceibacterota bacterium]
MTIRNGLYAGLASVMIVGLLAGLSVPIRSTYADTSASFVPVSGTDATSGSASALTTTPTGDIARLTASDDSRMASDGPWPGTGAYDEATYIEFVFAPGIPADATPVSVTVTNEYRRATALTAAKLEIWNGSVWQDVAISLPAVANTDLSETVDVSGILDTAEKINGAKVRFLAYRDTPASSATTSHDFIGLSVAYDESTSPTPSPTASPTPSETPEPTEAPTPSATPSVTPTPSETPVPMPDDTPTPTPSASPTPSATPTASPSPSASPTLAPSQSPTKTPHPTLTPKPTPKPPHGDDYDGHGIHFPFHQPEYHHSIGHLIKSCFDKIGGLFHR